MDLKDGDGRAVEGLLCGADQMLMFPMERAGPVAQVNISAVPLTPARMSIKKIIIS